MAPDLEMIWHVRLGGERDSAAHTAGVQDSLTHMVKMDDSPNACRRMTAG